MRRNELVDTLPPNYSVRRYFSTSLVPILFSTDSIPPLRQTICLPLNPLPSMGACHAVFTGLFSPLLITCSIHCIFAFVIIVLIRFTPALRLIYSFIRYSLRDSLLAYLSIPISVLSNFHSSSESASWLSTYELLSTMFCIFLSVWHSLVTNLCSDISLSCLYGYFHFCLASTLLSKSCSYEYLRAALPVNREKCFYFVPNTAIVF